MRNHAANLHSGIPANQASSAQSTFSAVKTLFRRKRVHALQLAVHERFTGYARDL